MFLLRAFTARSTHVGHDLIFISQHHAVHHASVRPFVCQLRQFYQTAFNPFNEALTWPMCNLLHLWLIAITNSRSLFSMLMRYLISIFSTRHVSISEVWLEQLHVFPLSIVDSEANWLSCWTTSDVRQWVTVPRSFRRPNCLKRDSPRVSWN